MKNILHQIAEKSRQKERIEADAIKAEIADPSTPKDRRNFLKKAALGGIALGGMMKMSVEDTIAQTTSNVQRASSPSELKITDMRIAMIAGKPIIRIDTNQGIYGLGEVRDAGDPPDRVKAHDLHVEQIAPQEVGIVRDLAAKSDVFIENFRVEVLEP